jgi:hypothetical protein
MKSADYDNVLEGGPTDVRSGEQFQVTSYAYIRQLCKLQLVSWHGQSLKLDPHQTLMTHRKLYQP